MEDMDIDHLTEKVIGAAIEVHKNLGPGLLESAYETCLAHELASRGIHFERQKPVSITYKEVLLDCGFRMDLWVENRLVVELKAVDDLSPIHRSQVITYLKLTGCRLGLLINFNVRKLVDGVIRVAN